MWRRIESSPILFVRARPTSGPARRQGPPDVRAHPTSLHRTSMQQEPSSSKQRAMALDETCIELPTGKMINTWHSEVYEVQFTIKNPEIAATNMLYSSEVVAGDCNQKIRISAKMSEKKLGCYVYLEQVIRHNIQRYTASNNTPQHLAAAPPLLRHHDTDHLPHHVARRHSRPTGDFRDLHEEYAGGRQIHTAPPHPNPSLFTTGRDFMGLQQPHHRKRYYRTLYGLQCGTSSRHKRGRRCRPAAPARAAERHDVPPAREPRNPVRIGDLMGEV